MVVAVLLTSWVDYVGYGGDSEGCFGNVGCDFAMISSFLGGSTREAFSNSSFPMDDGWAVAAGALLDIVLMVLEVTNDDDCR